MNTNYMSLDHDKLKSSLFLQNYAELELYRSVSEWVSKNRFKYQIINSTRKAIKSSDSESFTEDCYKQYSTLKLSCFYNFINTSKKNANIYDCVTFHMGSYVFLINYLVT